VPDDPQALVRLGRAKRARSARGAQLGRRPGFVARFPFRDDDVADRLAFPERDLPEGAREVAREVERDRLVDVEAPVLSDLDDDVRRRQREELGGCVSGKDERCDERGS
jgi:hypothetical protein